MQPWYPHHSQAPGKEASDGHSSALLCSSWRGHTGAEWVGAVPYWCSLREVLDSNIHQQKHISSPLVFAERKRWDMKWAVCKPTVYETCMEIFESILFLFYLR